MTQNNFNKAQNDAIKQMKEMNARSVYKENEPKEKSAATQPQNSSGSFLGGLNLPFLDKLKKDSDLTLILGILLLLFSEKADKRLLFALIYILL